MHIIQVHLDDRGLGLCGISGHVQKIGIDAGLFLDIVGQKIILSLEMVIETSVRYAGLFADILDGELLISLLLEDMLGGAEDFCLGFF